MLVQGRGTSESFTQSPIGAALLHIVCSSSTHSMQMPTQYPYVEDYHMTRLTKAGLKMGTTGIIYVDSTASRTTAILRVFRPSEIGMTSVDVQNSFFTKFRHDLQLLQSTATVDIVNSDIENNEYGIDPQHQNFKFGIWNKIILGQRGYFRSDPAS